MDGILIKIVVLEGKIARVFSAIGYIGAAGESIAEEAAAEEEIEAVPKRAASGIDVAALRKKVAAKARGKKVKIKASGRARKLADQHGIDILLIEGSGPKGRIVEKDVQAYIDQGPVVSEAAQAAARAASTPAPVSAPGDAGAVRGQTIPMTRMRQVIARRLQQSKQTIPHFYVTVTVDMTDAIKAREELNAKADKDGKVSMNDMVVKAAAIALSEFPQVNCKIDEDSIVYLEDINIGVAVGLDNGLVVPVLPEVDTLSLKGIAKKTKELVSLAKAGKQASLTPGTFTISNMGMLDVDNFVAIINPPETAILAVGSVRKTLVVAEDNSFQVRDTISMTLSADHRAVDGVLGSKFANRIKYGLENPQTLLG
jgi:pyruvate dehydrogenase E2 component (dihydrolipoamide acetyltransferase)